MQLDTEVQGRGWPLWAWKSYGEEDSTGNEGSLSGGFMYQLILTATRKASVGPFYRQTN